VNAISPPGDDAHDGSPSPARPSDLTSNPVNDAGPAPLARARPRSSALPGALPEILTADELAAFLRVSRKTVYAGFKAGEIPGGKRIGGTIRFHRDAVLRWLAEGQVSRSSRSLR
jgi:excisionase family DNA binding protein